MNKSIIDDEIVRTIQLALSEFSWLFIHIRKHNGTLSLPKEFIDFYSEVEQPPWSSYYQSQQQLDTLPLLFFFDAEDLREFSLELEKLESDERKTLLAEIDASILDFCEEEESSPYNFNFMNQSEYREYLDSTTLDEQKSDLLRAYFFFTTFITQVFQFLSLVTHGQSMHDLVKAAIEGDDLAFCRAVQIDRTTLFGIRYFQKRLIRMQLGNEKNLLNSLSRAINGKIWGNRFPNPELWLVFSLLDRTNLLKGLSNDELLDLCNELRVTNETSTKIISKRKNEYLKRQLRVF